MQQAQQSCQKDFEQIETQINTTREAISQFTDHRSEIDQLEAQIQHRRQELDHLLAHQGQLQQSLQQLQTLADEYEDSYKKALKRVDPKKTFEGAQLSGKIDSILRQADLSSSADIDPVKTREGEIFNVRLVLCRMHRAGDNHLVKTRHRLPAGKLTDIFKFSCYSFTGQDDLDKPGYFFRVSFRGCVCDQYVHDDLAFICCSLCPIEPTMTQWAASPISRH